jgi:hypothetical protein
MAEEQKAQSTTEVESLIQVSPEFAEVVSAIASRRRRSKPQEADVEGHAMTVEEFSAEGSFNNVVCGAIYADA